MELVAVDWFKDTKRMDHVARRKGCAVQVSSCLNSDIMNTLTMENKPSVFETELLLLLSVEVLVDRRIK